MPITCVSVCRVLCRSRDWLKVFYSMQTMWCTCMSTKAYKIRHLGVWIIIFDRNPIKAYVLQKFFSLCLGQSKRLWCVMLIFLLSFVRSFSFLLLKWCDRLNCLLSNLCPFGWFIVSTAKWKHRLACSTYIKFIICLKCDVIFVERENWSANSTESRLVFVINRHLRLRSLLMIWINHNEFSREIWVN